MEETLEQKYDRLMSVVSSILEVFNLYYGEERVDLQNFMRKEEFIQRANPTISDEEAKELIGEQGKIIVHFPRVTVTNENDRSVEITNLWVKIVVTLEGLTVGRFSMARSEFPITHILADYAHSHLDGIPYDNPSYFGTPCTGSGPINRTITSLCAQFDLDFWRLYCYELDLFTQVESLAGTPWRKLESIGAQPSMQKIKENTLLEDTCLNRSKNLIHSGFLGMTSDFIKYFVNKRDLTFVYSKEEYTLGMSFLEFRIKISNRFIEWYNREDNPYRHHRGYSLQNLLDRGYLSKCIVEGPSVYRVVSSRSRHYGNWDTKEQLLNHFDNKFVLAFKGQRINTHLIDDSNEDTTATFANLLSENTCKAILFIILRTLNFNIARYGTEWSSTRDSSTSRECRFV